MNNTAFNKLIDEYVKVEGKKKELEETLSLIKEQLISEGVTELDENYVHNGYSMTYVKPVRVVGLDTKRIKKERPEILKEFPKITERKGSVRISKLKKGE